MTEILLYAGGLIILVLVIVAASLHWRLYLIKKQIKQKQAEADQQYQLARSRLNQSIQIICRAILDDQIGYAEASLRISALMDQLSVSEVERSEFVTFDKFAQAIAHIPILDAWKQLPKNQRKQYEVEIQRHEEEFGDFVRDAAQRLIGRTF